MNSLTVTCIPSTTIIWICRLDLGNYTSAATTITRIDEGRMANGRLDMGVEVLLMMIVLLLDDQRWSGAQRRLGYHIQRDAPRMTNPLTTAFTRFTRECSQELLHLMRKQACVKVFSFIFNYNQSQSYPNKNLQLKYMNQQNIVVETIINRIISRSRKNSLESFDCKTVSQKSEYSHQSEPFDQEYIIKKSDLRSFIQKMALQNYENNITIEKKAKQNQQMRNEVEKWKGQCEQLRKTFQKSEQVNIRKIQDLQGKCLKLRKQRQRLDSELSWSTNKIKDHMRQIDKLKQSIMNKNQPKRELQNGSANRLSTKEKNEYVTPGKEGSKKLQNLNVKNCQSIDYSVILNSDVVQKFIIENYPQAIRECSTEQSKQRNCVLNSLENHSSKKGGQNIEMSRLHRHTQIDEKERMLKMLGEKCIFLEGYIQKLTKKYLGEVVYSQQSERDRYDDGTVKQQPATNLKVIEQQSASSLQRSESDIGLSNAFRVQPQI